MEIKEYSFKTDSDIVQKAYKEYPNYLIESNNSVENDKICAIYFTSNDLYYPDNEETFKTRVIEKNSFEWYGNRIQKACKHIFVRDVCKQWYLIGINHIINSPKRLLDFLQKETTGYQVITVGSSAGGYAATLYGSLLHAAKIMAFNPQFELHSLLSRSTECTNPLVHRMFKSHGGGYFNISNYISNPDIVFYFYSNKSRWDIEQAKVVESVAGLHRIAFHTSHHGIPFLKVALPVVLNLDTENLLKFEKKEQHPLWFTIKMVGIIDTFVGFIRQAYRGYKKRH